MDATTIISAIALGVSVGGSVLKLAREVGRLSTVIDGVEGRFAKLEHRVDMEREDTRQIVLAERQERKEADGRLERRQSGMEKRLHSVEVWHAGASREEESSR